MDITGSSILFLQDLSTADKSFDTAGGTSAFRIRHDTVGGYLVFEGRSGSSGPFPLLTLNDDTNTVTFGGVVSFEDIIFDLITGSHLYILSSSRFLGTTSINVLHGINTNDSLVLDPGRFILQTGSNSSSIYVDSSGALNFTSVPGGVQITDGILSLGDSITASFSYDGSSNVSLDRGLFLNNITSSYLYIGSSSIFRGTSSFQYISLTSSTGTASIWYDGSLMHIDGFKSGNSWRSLYQITLSLLLTNTYSIYTTSNQQLILHYDYLSVFINGDMLLQSKSGISDWDYKSGNTSNSIIFRYNIPYVSGDNFYITYMYNGGVK